MDEYELTMKIIEEEAIEQALEEHEEEIYEQARRNSEL